MSRRGIEDWRRDVFASTAPEMTGSVKVLLLYLADRMGQLDRKVSVPRQTIAKALGCHEQRVAERFKRAVDAGFLVPVSPGYRGRTAVYQGTWPDPVALDCVPQTGTQSVRKRTDPPDAFSPRKAVRIQAGMRTAPLDAISRADLSVSPHGRDVGSEEKTEDQPARGYLTACPWHDDAPCPADCKYAPPTARREGTA